MRRRRLIRGEKKHIRSDIKSNLVIKCHKTFIFSEMFANLSSALWFLQSYRKAALISKQCSDLL